MTDLAPAVFRGRQAALERLERTPTTFTSGSLDQQYKIATSLAHAGEAVPKVYRNNPGAVLLALGWAGQHDVDVLTAIQNVSFIGGRAVVDATLQRGLLRRHGYTVAIPEATNETATVEIHQGDRLLGTATYTWADAETAKLTVKDNWKQNPGDMLVARATTRAIRRFAPDVLLGMVSSDELDEPADLTEAMPGQTAPDPVEAVELITRKDAKARVIADLVPILGEVDAIARAAVIWENHGPKGDGPFPEADLADCFAAASAAISEAAG